MNQSRIDIRKSLTLGSAGDQPLHGDLFLPDFATDKNALQSRPAIVLIFGGSWKSGDRSQQKVYGIALAKAGFVCLATDYRWSGQARWPAQLDDVKTAISWLRTHAEDYSVDPDRIAVSGNSSGGHLALMVAAESAKSTRENQEAGDCSGFSSPVKAVCAFYPPTRLRGLDEQIGDSSVSDLLGPDATPAELDLASPIFHASKPFPPVLLMSGAQDQRVPVDHTWQLHDALQKAGNRVDLHVFAGLGHAFDAERDFALLSAVIMADFFRRYV